MVALGKVQCVSWGIEKTLKIEATINNMYITNIYLIASFLKGRSCILYHRIRFVAITVLKKHTMGDYLQKVIEKNLDKKVIHFQKYFSRQNSTLSGTP